MYCIVDVETTGGVPGPSRLTEIAMIRHNGHHIVDTFHTLLNPGCPIPPFICRLTGITDAMVEHAPTFDQVAQQVLELSADAIFVAHNASFDFGFLQKELGWLERPFLRRTLCTVRLSRKIFPGYNSYSLGNICESLAIPVSNRHRAMGDAQATAKLFEMLLENDRFGIIPKPHTLIPPLA